MIFCLTKNQVDLFLQKLKTGEIDPAKLSEMSSAERNAYFSSFMGEANAVKVNSLFESKLLLKNQQQGIINWAKQVSGIKPEVKRDLLSRVEKMTQVLQPKDMDSFLADLVATKLGVGVSMEEAGKIADLAKTTADKKALITEDSPTGSKERIDYGTALVIFKDYVSQLKTEAKENVPKTPFSYGAKAFDVIAGTTKAILSSLDNSFFGRQGLVTLINQPKIWIDNFGKSWGDIGKELKGVDAMLPIKADVFSRPNAINGKYQAMGLDIGIMSEEAFPSSLPEKIPLLGKLYKASESAYNGAALRMRADLADTLIPRVEEMGISVKEKDAGLGLLINSMTGRGNIAMTPGQAKTANIALFSIKYLKSNFDVLTAHLLEPNMRPEVKKMAANNILKTVGVLAGVLATAKLFDDESVNLDPRSSDFGKIMVGENHKTKINITAGMGSLITLAARIVPTTHNGKLGWWKINAKGRYVQTNIARYGGENPFDIITSFLSGKTSPVARVLLDSMKGRTMRGTKPTIGGEITTATVPIPAQNLYQLAQSPDGEDKVLFAVLTALDLLGVNVNPENPKK
ncbi:MAG: hypothetical protein WC481_08450 [Candidatus Omnitrophota bacterium]